MGWEGTAFKDEAQFKEFCKIMDGMEEVNQEMVEKMEASIVVPKCHFTKMEYKEGFWTCKHYGHEIEDEQYFIDCYDSY